MQTWLLNARSLWSVSEKEAGSSPNQFLLPFAMERLKAFSSSKRNKKKLRDIYVTVSYLNKWDLQNQENMTKNMDSYKDPSFWLLPKLPTWTKLWTSQNNQDETKAIATHLFILSWNVSPFAFSILIDVFRFCNSFSIFCFSL